MAVQRYEVRRRIMAPRRVVWELVSNAERWSEWSGLPRSARERPGRGAPDGTGSVRRLGFPPIAGSREEVVLHDPPRQMGYVILSGLLPVRRYRADVVLEESGDATELLWTGSFQPLVPGTGSLMRNVVERLIGSFAERLAGHSERSAG